MTTPLTDATASPQASTLNSLSPRQRLETALGQLPPAGSAAVAGAVDNADGIGGDTLVEPVRRINEVMRPFGVEFELSETRSRTITRIVDRDSGEVIRQIPAEEVLRIVERLEELQGRLIRLEA